ncbi:unnamed protein product [Nezara viridula]|uniref:C2H2-type domain-containing protein n=1 Tax=Nezara viridula TaxID=85310 RepID=A0A9P0GZR0_NEZVI|nr:unnamed protein product [Nezara viridula]
MDYSEDQEEIITFERKELQEKDYYQGESISADRTVEDEGKLYLIIGCLDISTMLEVVLKEEEGSFIPNYKTSEDLKIVDTGFSTQTEIGSLPHNTCENINTIQKIEKIFQCRICDHSTKRSSDMSRHIKEVHLKYRPYRCGICGYRTYRTYTLRVHMQTVHRVIKSHCRHIKNSPTGVLEVPQKLNNQQASKHVFTYSNGMNNFYNCVMKVNKIDKTFFCSFCHLRTKWAGSLRNHIFAVHMKEKPHNCPICKYKSAARYSIMRHIKAVHMKDKPHLCPVCPYKSTRSDTLKVHMKRLHPENSLTRSS